MHVFSFVLAVTEVNAFLAYRFFCRPDPVPTLQQFRHKLACELIQNKWLARESLDKLHVVSAVHQLMVAPNKAGGGATQNILTRTTRARSNNVVSHPNASNLLLLLPNKVDLQVLPCCARCIRVETGVEI
jgi:hypothetical protein